MPSARSSARYRRELEPRSAMPSSGRRRLDWLESLSPWPRDGFGLGRMQTLLAELGDPQLEFPSIHVVGTNGKSTTTRTIEEMLAREGLLAGVLHVAARHGLGRADSRRRRGSRRRACAVAACGRRRSGSQATQFEVLTAAALAEFAADGVDVAVVEAGLGGRHDATNVLRSPVQVLTNVVARAHATCSARPARRSPRRSSRSSSPGRRSCLGEPEWEPLAREHGAARVVVEPAATRRSPARPPSAFLGRDVEPGGRQPSRAARAPRRRDPRRCAHPGGGALRRAQAADRRRDRRVDPRRQGRRRDAARCSASLADALVATASSNPSARCRRTSSPSGRGPTSSTSRPSPTRRPRSREATSSASRCSSPASLYLLADLAAPPSAEPTYHGRERRS